MSYLQLGALGWDIFGKKAEQKRKAQADAAAAALQKQQQEYEQKLRDEERAKVDKFRALLQQRAAQIEHEVVQIATLVEKIRKYAADPLLQGDPILDEAENQLADMENTLVKVQAGTVVDLATYDSNALAVSYADAQAGLVALQALRNRVVGLHKALESKVNDLNAEKIRAERAQKEAEYQAQLLRQRLEEEARQAELDASRRAEEAGRVRRMELLQQHMSIDAQIVNEKRALRRAQQELEALRVRGLPA